MTSRKSVHPHVAVRAARRQISRQVLNWTISKTIEPLERRLMMAATIGVNFSTGQGAPGVFPVGTASAGVVAMTGWNDVTGATGSAAITDSTGAAAGNVSWQSNNNWDTATQEDHTDQFPAGSGDFNLMAGYLDNAGGTAVATPAALTSGTLNGNGILFSNLPAATTYNVYCYDMQAVIGRGGGVTVTGTTASPQQQIITSQQYSTFKQGATGNFLIFPGVTPTNGKILINSDGTSFRVGFEGIELVPNTVTTPPAAITNLTAAYSSATATVNLNFTDNDPNVLRFQVLRSTSATGPFTQIDLISPNANGAYSFADNGIAPGGSYYYEVIAQNGVGNSPPSNIAGPVAIPTTNGAEAHYYNAAYWTGTPAVSTQVLTVNQNWPTGSPDPAIRTSNNSSVFTGKIHTDAAGTYTLISNTDDDGYLYVNGQLVSVDAPTGGGGHGQRNASTLFPISLAANTDYDFVLLQDQGGGGAGANMLWIEPGGMTPVIVPASHLTPTSDAPQTPSNLAIDTLSPLSPNPNAHAVDFTFDSNNNAVVHYQLQRRPGSSTNASDWVTVNQADPGGPATAQDFANPGEFIEHIEDASSLPGTSYQYRVVAVNFDQTSIPSNVLSVSTPAATQAPGVEARYFNGELAASPQNPRAIAVIGSPTEFFPDNFGIPIQGGSAFPIDANFGNGSPDTAAYPDVQRIHIDDFATVFTGKIHTDAAGMYTFITNSDDDGYMFVNDVLVSSDPGGHGTEIAPNLVPISLAANSEYDFILIQQERGGGAAVHANWVEPDGMGGTLASAVIPAYSPGVSGGFEMVMDNPNKQTLNPSGVVVTDNTQSAAGNLILSASTVAGGNVISWADQSFSEVWFQVERSTDGVSYSVIGKAGFDTNTFTDSTATVGNHYFYRVRGMNWDAQGTASNVADTANGVTLPTPTLASETCVPNQVDLIIGNQSPNSGGFELQYHDNTSTTFVDVPGASSLPNTTTRYVVSGLDPTKTYTFQARNLNGTGTNGNSPYSAPLTASAAGSTPVAHSTGFTGATDITTNGNASLATVGTGTVLQITAALNGQTSSAYATMKEGVAAFDTTFDFQYNQGASNPGADGFTFLIQNNNVHSIGGGGGNLGYQGMGNSIAVKFDLWNGSPGTPPANGDPDGGGGVAAYTGLFINGDASVGTDTLSTTPGQTNISYNMKPNIDFHRHFADTFRAHLAYDGTTLTETVTDLTTNATFTMSWAVNIPQTVGDDCAFVGFTGATGGANAEQDIVNWSYTPLPAPAVSSQTITGTAGNDTITLRKDATDPTKDDVWVNVPTTGAPTMMVSNGRSIFIAGLGGTDTLVLDTANGNPLPTGGTGTVLRLDSTPTGTFALGGTALPVDATHVMDLGKSTLTVPHTIAALPAVQTDLKNGFIVSSDAAGSSGKFAIADTNSTSQVTLQYAIIGDADVNGTVGFPDLLKLAQHYGQSGQDWSTGDFTYDGIVGFPDLLLLAQHYGQHSPAAAAGSLAAATAASSLSSPADTLASALLKGKKARK